VVLKGKSKNHIDLEVLETAGGKWWFTGVTSRVFMQPKIRAF